MSTFLNSLKDNLTAIEQEMQALPGGLDSAVARLDRGKLRSLFSRLDQDFNKVLDRLFDGQRINALLFPFIFMPDGWNGPLSRRITQEDLSRWRDAHKSEIRVVVGKGGVTVIAISELAKEYKVTIPQITLIAQEQGYTVLGWDQYQTLLDEMGKLIGEDKESLPGVVTGIPIMAPDSPQEVKILPKGSPS